MMQLEASNEYIAAIFDCYKSLVKHFRKYGFMKKVYETAVSSKQRFARRSTWSSRPVG